jgi:hypothetical protein
MLSKLSLAYININNWQDCPNSNFICKKILVYIAGSVLILTIGQSLLAGQS